MSKVAKQTWHLFDAKNQTVGRMSQHIATILMGKHKPTFTHNVDCGDTVVVLNAKDVRFTGNKWTQKVYRRHSGYVGGLNEVSAAHWRRDAPERVIMHAVRGMIPKTKHKLNQMARLRVYPAAEHPFVNIFPNHPATLSNESVVKPNDPEAMLPLTDSWAFPEGFSEDTKQKLLAEIEYTVEPQDMHLVKLKGGKN